MAEIRLNNVSKIYEGGSIALEHISIEIVQGEFVFLTGRSGAGKSTFLKLMGGQEQPTSGEIYVNGVAVSSIPRHRIPHFRRQFGTMKRDLGLLNNMSVRDNIIFSLRATGHSGRGMAQQADHALGLTGIRHRAAALPTELSGGETARVLLARAISGNPAVLLVDEPTANLDSTSSWDIMCLLTELNRNGITVFVASHDHEMVSVMRRRVVTLSAGRIVADERNAIYNMMAADILEERRVLNERKLSRSREAD